MFSQRKLPAPEPSPRMRYYLSNLPTQLRSPEDFDRLSRLMGELPRDILNERMSHKEVRLVRREFAKLLKAARRCPSAGRAFLLPLPAPFSHKQKRGFKKRRKRAAGRGTRRPHRLCIKHFTSRSPSSASMPSLLRQDAMRHARPEA